jgi:hypothetical protein
MTPRTDLRELQRSFVAPPGLGRSLPRDVRLTAAGWVVRVASLSLLAVALVVFVTMSRLASRQANDRRLLAETSIETTAAVTRLWRNEGRSRQTWVAYRFTVSDRVFEREAEIRLRAGGRSWDRRFRFAFLPRIPNGACRAGGRLRRCRSGCRSWSRLPLRQPNGLSPLAERRTACCQRGPSAPAS